MIRVFTFLTFILLLSTNTFSSEYYKNSDASGLVNGTQELWFKNNSAVPSYIRFEESFILDENQVFGWLKEEFNLSEELNFIPIRVFMTDDKVRHMVFQPTFNDVPVEFARITLHTRNGRVLSLNGHILKDAQISNNLSLSKSDAIDIALNTIQSAQYKWDVPEEEKWLQERTGNKNATYFPKPEKVILSRDITLKEMDLRYAYKMNVYSNEPFASEDIYIDAEDGKVLFRHDAMKEIDTTGIAHTAYSGMRQIQTDQWGQFYFLREKSRGNGIHTWDLNQSTDFSSAVEFKDEDNNWIYAQGDLDVYATDAHWGAEVTYDYLSSHFGRNSVNDSGLALESYVHYGEAFNNAFWDGQNKVMVYGDGLNNLIPLTTLDIVGHEIGHGLTQYTANLIYQGESGALNESFSDILGNCVEYFGKPGQASWRIGEDRGSFLRDMSFPNAKSHPDTYMGDFWYSGTNDNGGVHTNSGVQNYWFYLLSEGGNGMNDLKNPFNVSGIGIMNAAQIAYRTLNVYLTPTSDYEEASFYSSLSAKDLFGNCSPQYQATVMAWNAVGLQNEYIDHTVASFEADKVNYCNLPFTITFLNESVNGVTYLWDFGDGTTSEEVSPSHEYTQAGKYTVKLIVDGEGCGNDVLVMEDLIEGSSVDVPQANSASIYRGDSVLLSAEAMNGEIHWYADMAATELIGKGNIYQTPSLNSDVTYYIKSVLEGMLHEVGADLIQAQNDGGFSGLNVGLEFDAQQDLVINSISVKAQLAGKRSFVIKDANNNEVFRKEVELKAGVQEVLLDAFIPHGNAYVLSYQGNVKNLMMAAEDNYPYNYSGLVSITRNTLDLDNTYPYFFNWKVKEVDCSSDVSSVPVSVRDIDEVKLPPYKFYVNNTNGLNYFVDLFFKQNTSVQFALYGINGQLVYEIEKEFPKGENTEDVNELLELNSYPTGVYFFTINGGGIEETEKIVNKGGSN